MNEDLQPGQHLSPDQLSAFAENALPEHERLAALTHLADCADCRQVVFFTQRASPVLTSPAVETPRRAWFTLPQIFVAAGAALACSLILVLIVHYSVQNSTTPPVTTAQLQPPPAPTPQPSAPPSSSQGPAKISSASSKPSAPEINYSTPPPPAQVKIPAAPVVIGGMGAGMATGRAYAPPAAEPKTTDKQSFALDGLADDSTSLAAPAPQPAAGAVAMQNAMPAAPAAALENRARKAYTATAAAPVALPSAPPPPPPPPSTAESVTVNAADATLLDTLPSTGRAVQNYAALKPGVAQPLTLPSKKPVASQLNAGTRTLALDTAGTLFLSKDHGQHWTTVKPQWSGKAVSLAFAPTPTRLYQVQPQQTQTQQQAVIPTAGFQLTTATGAVFVSTKGLIWHAR